MQRYWLAVCGALGAVGVLLGLFLPNLLGSRILPLQMMTIFETGVRYHLFHTLALLGAVTLAAQHPGRAGWLQASAWLFLAGILMFSGGFYALALTNAYWLRWLATLGGVSLIAGWSVLGYASWRR